MKKKFIDDQLNMVSEWGVAKRYSRYSDVSQIIHLDDKIGEGYFASYDFEKLSLLKLEGQFYQDQKIRNQHSHDLHTVYFLLEGEYSFYKEDTCVYQLTSPSFWLFSGNTNIPLTAHVPANKTIKAFQIHLSETFINIITTQLKDRPFAKQSLLQHFILQAHASKHPSELEVPFSKSMNDIFQKAWNLFNIRHPTDEMTLLSLQGETFTFFSELLKLPYTYVLENTHDIPSYAIQAKLLLDQFYAENWTTRDLARKVNTNESYLKKHFKALTGMSLNEYRTHIRMAKATDMLAKGVASQEVAHRLGFASHHYFRKVYYAYFKK